MKKVHIPRWVPWLTLMFLLTGLFLVQELRIQSAISAAAADPKTEVLISLITNLGNRNRHQPVYQRRITAH